MRMVANRANTYTVIMMWHLFDRTLTIDEMPVHNHSASISSVGSHAHGIRRRLGYTNDRNEVSSWGTGPAYNRLAEVPQAPTEYAGGFNQTISVNNTGGNKSHENRQPYTVVNVWTRTV